VGQESKKKAGSSKTDFILGRVSEVGLLSNTFPLLGSDSFPRPFSLLLLSFLAVTPFHFHVYFPFVSPLPFSSIIYLFLLLLLLPHFLRFLLLHIGSLSALHLVLRLLSPRPSSPWFSIEIINSHLSFNVTYCSNVLVF